MRFFSNEKVLAFVVTFFVSGVGFAIFGKQTNTESVTLDQQDSADQVCTDLSTGKCLPPTNTPMPKIPEIPAQKESSPRVVSDKMNITNDLDRELCAANVPVQSNSVALNRNTNRVEYYDGSNPAVKVSYQEPPAPPGDQPKACAAVGAMPTSSLPTVTYDNVPNATPGTSPCAGGKCRQRGILGIRR